jgi:hypothetical protein
MFKVTKKRLCRSIFLIPLARNWDDNSDEVGGRFTKKDFRGVLLSVEL